MGRKGPVLKLVDKMIAKGHRGLGRVHHADVSQLVDSLVGGTLRRGLLKQQPTRIAGSVW